MVRATASDAVTVATTGMPVTSTTSRSVRLRPFSTTSTIPSGSSPGGSSSAARAR